MRQKHEITEEISGTVTCSCGWKSQHYALAIDAFREWVQHEKAGK